MADFRRDSAGLARFAKTAAVRSALHAYADPMAVEVKADAEQHVEGGVEVEVDDYTTDRAAVSVTIAHAAGIGLQAKHGTLTKAASGQGLDVSER